MKSIVSIGRLAVVGASFGAAFALVAARHMQPDEHLIEDVLWLVYQRYVRPISSDSLMLKANKKQHEEKGDPYARLYTPAVLSVYTTTLLGHNGGVGMRMEDRDGAATVLQVY